MGRFTERDWAQWDLEHPYVPHPKEASAPTQTYVSHADNPRPGMGDIKLSPGQIESMRTGSAAPFMNDKGEFTPERQALHDKIVSDAVNGVSPSEHPELIMTGGGGGSGKSAMLDQGLVPVPDSYVKNDPDAIKAELPEAEQMQADGDKTWAAFTHEESSYLSARIVDASYSTGKSMVLDTTGNTNAAKIGAKIQAARDAGYSVTGNYMTVTPDAGVARAMARADATGREVPEAVLRSTYKSISDVFPQVSEVFDKVNLFDNNGPKGSTPTLIASGGRGVGGLTVHDAAKYNQFLSYGSQ